MPFTPPPSFIEFRRDEIEQSIARRFEQQVVAFPDHIAIKSKTYQLTYAELNSAANRISRAIVARSGTAPEIVALLFESDAPMLVAIFAALKAGKVFVSLDVRNPLAQLRYIVENSESRLILTDTKHLTLAQQLIDIRHALLNIDQVGSPSDTNLELVIPPDAPLCITYTSGSTGQPKGVLFNQRNKLHKIMIRTNSSFLCADDRASLFGSASFAGVQDDMFGALLNGAGIFRFNLKAEGLANLGEWLFDEEITVYHSAPSLFRRFASSLKEGAYERFPRLRLIMLGGEAVLRNDIELYKRHFSDRCVTLVSLSSTEAGRICVHAVDKDTRLTGTVVPVGYALPNKHVRLLDEEHKPVGVNQVGEIAVVSRFMSLGYWRNAQLTQARFRPSPNGGDERMFLTGDLGRMSPDGLLEHLGRVDEMVKIRGHRVEPAAIESALLEHPMIRECVVVARASRDGENQLVAFLVPRQFPAPTTSELRDLLTRSLPSYMIPARYVVLECLPYNAHGKIDRQALPAPEQRRPELGVPFVAPRTELETTLADIWADILELDRVGIDDNFFELGGDSLSALRMIMEVENIAQQPVPPDYFGSPTVAALVEILERGSLPTTSSTSSESPIHRRRDRDARRTFWKLRSDQVSAAQAMRWAIPKMLARLEYSRGIRWLAWLGQAAIANRLYRDEREYFCGVAAELASPSAAHGQAFRISVFGNLLWICQQQLRSESELRSGNMIDIMHASRHWFWRSFASRIDHAITRAEYGQIIKFSGLEHLYQAHKMKRGTILLTYHSPASAIAKALLLRRTNLRDIPTISLESAQQMADRETPALDESLEKRGSVWSAINTLQGQRILTRGGVIQIVNDVSYHDRNSIAKSIGGRRYDLKPGFAELALSTGACVLPVYSVFDLRGVVHTTILPALKPLGTTAGHTAAVDDLLDQYVAFLEDTWRKVPESMGWGALRRFVTRPQFATRVSG